MIKMVNGRAEMEANAIRLLRKGLQPAEISVMTGVSQTWIELKARVMGKRPYEMATARMEKKKK
jgi:uncharacterized protein YerC